MRMTVTDLMSETPVTIAPDCTGDEALDMIFEYETPELYVVDKSGRLLGVLPDYELLKTQLSGKARDARVEQLMSRSVPVCSPSTDAAEIARLFRDSKNARLPVVKQGRLVGVVTRGDVLRLMAVLRRIDAPVKKSIPGPRRPKMLDRIEPRVAPKVTGRTTAAKSTTRSSRSKPVNRRTKAASVS